MQWDLKYNILSSFVLQRHNKKIEMKINNDRWNLMNQNNYNYLIEPNICIKTYITLVEMWKMFNVWRPVGSYPWLTAKRTYELSW